MNQLYGVKYLENQRSSAYKSTVYAMAEIVDNSVDAKASKIQIIFSENEDYSGQRKRYSLDRIVFIDNGTGMTEERLNGCLTFAEGSGKNDARIGAFGVGLPNSSISVCRKVEVYSRTNESAWKYVKLDLDEQSVRAEPGYDLAIQKTPTFLDLELPDDSNTIIIWSKLDRLDVARAKTLVERSNRLLGRIYRYKIQEGLKIELIETSLVDNSVKKMERVIPYDPLFVMEEENYITSYIWESSEREDPKGKTPELSHLPEFNSIHYYKKFVDGLPRNRNRSLFQKFEDYWDVPFTTVIGDLKFKWTMRASFAYSDITNPGVRNGGGTKLGMEFGKKMSGDAHFPSGNIFFIRAGREIDFGNFGMYTVTDEKNRFWTIEIHFDSELDDLMGLSNDKQSVKFKAITRSDLNDLQELIITKSLGAQREILWSEITEKIKRAIKEMRFYLSNYAREFKNLEESHLNDPVSKGQSIPTVEPAVMNVIPRGNQWTETQKTEVVDFLKERFMHIPEENISTQVNQFSEGLTKTIVLYAPNQTGKLFELTEKQGKLITLINTNHQYYLKVLEPLKSDSRLKIFAISIELLISSFSLEMERLMLDNEEKYEEPLNRFLIQVSSRLEEFINDSNLKINFDYNGHSDSE
jgi:hypothetical protein